MNDIYLNAVADLADMAEQYIFYLKHVAKEDDIVIESVESKYRDIILRIKNEEL